MLLANLRISAAALRGCCHSDTHETHIKALGTIPVLAHVFLDVFCVYLALGILGVYFTYFQALGLQLRCEPILYFSFFDY